MLRTCLVPPDGKTPIADRAHTLQADNRAYVGDINPLMFSDNPLYSAVIVGRLAQVGDEEFEPGNQGVARRHVWASVRHRPWRALRRGGAAQPHG